MTNNLNPAQQKAVTHPPKPLVVFAGAGSGKTRVITHRVAYLIESLHFHPSTILAVTFTNKAAKEMKERLAELLGPSAQQLWIGTFHSLCAKLLRIHAHLLDIRPDFTIYDDSDQQALIKRILKDLSLNEKQFLPKAIASYINKQKQDLFYLEELTGETPFEDTVIQIFHEYQACMKRANAFDFGDLIYQLVLAAQKNDLFKRTIAAQFKAVLVDEFQDTNRIQFKLVELFSQEHQNLCVVGDDDQSIYKWRGAERKNILDFKHHYSAATLIKLEENYRSTGRILRIANHLIEKNQDREPKSLWTQNLEGAKAVAIGCQNEQEEAHCITQCIREMLEDGFSLTDIAVFYRTHAQSRALEEALRAENMPYRIIGGIRFYDRAEVKDILAYLKAIYNPDDDVSLLRTINQPKRGIGKTTVLKLTEIATGQNRSVFEILCSLDQYSQIKNAAKKKLYGFKNLIEELKKDTSTLESLADIGKNILEKTGYLSLLEKEDTPEADARIQNLQELVNSMAEFEQMEEKATLAGFLERTALQSEHVEEDSPYYVSLMTIHASKGLEFPLVILCGLEEGIFPMTRPNQPWDDIEEIEEERRLAYVAVTRAQKRLMFTWAKWRSVFGQRRFNLPSRFFFDMPTEDLIQLGEPFSSNTTNSPFDTSSDFIDQTPENPASTTDNPPVENENESYVHYDEYSDTSEIFSPGSRVKHQRFGLGKIQSYPEGNPPRVEVLFDQEGVKQVILKFLTPIP